MATPTERRPQVVSPIEPMPRRVPMAGSIQRVLVALAVVLAVALVAALGLVGWIGSERALHGTPHKPDHTLAEYAFQVEEVYFASRDGTLLAGWFVKGTRPETVLVVHGFHEGKENVLTRVAMLQRAGFNVFAIDLRNSGQSGGSDTTFGYFERYDVAGAADYLLTRSEVDPGRIGALGVSMGAASVLLGAVDTDALRAIVAEGSYESIDSVVAVGFEHFLNLPAFPFAPITVKISEWRAGISASQIRPIDAVARLVPRPLLFITGLDATEIRYQDSIDLFKAAHDPRQLWLIPGATHANGIDVAPAEYAARVTAFFNESLAAGGQKAAGGKQ